MDSFVNKMSCHFLIQFLSPKLVATELNSLLRTAHLEPPATAGDVIVSVVYEHNLQLILSNIIHFLSNNSTTVIIHHIKEFPPDPMSFSMYITNLSEKRASFSTFKMLKASLPFHYFQV